MSGDTLSKRQELSEAKRALLEKRLRGEVAVKRAPAIGRVAGPGPVHPMSFAQERMWFLDQMDPGSPVYNIAAAGLLPADTDVDALRRALTEVVRRHEALRTVFRLEDGKPAQVVLPPYDVELPVIEMRHRIPQDNPYDEVRVLVGEEGKIGFDLSTGPLLRAKMFRVTDAEYAFSLTVHHIATDGWSMPLITSEMEQIFGAYLEGRPSPLPELPIQFADYAVWQRDYLQGPTLEKHLAYWKERLAGVTPLELPTDRPRPPVWSNRGDFYRFMIPRDLSDRLVAFCRREQVTMNHTLMAAFMVLLQRWSGQGDLAVGTLLGNRNRAELEALIGLFVNTGVIRTDLSDDPYFLELLAAVRDRVLEADEHQDLPFERVVDALGVERDLSRNPVFQAMYFHHTFVQMHGMHAPDEGYLHLTQLYETGVSLVDIETAAFDLMLVSLQPAAGGMACMFEYGTDLFERETIARWAREYIQILESIEANPHQRVSRLEILPEDERRSLAAWSAGPADTPAPDTLHRLFARQAERTPDAVAVELDGRRMTYRELDALSSRVAHRLRSLGVGPEAVVAQLLDRSPEMVAGMLGTWKAGGAYLPIDTAYPADRVKYLLDDSGARAVLTESRFLDRIASDIPTIAFDRDRGMIEAESTDSPSDEVGPEQLAYVIYTSGSTGLAKGVEVTHGPAAVHVQTFAREYALSGDDAVLVFASPSFDVSLEQLLPALVSGGRLVLRGAEAWTVDDFVRQVRDRRITIADPPTAYWQQLAADPSVVAELAKHLRLITVGGEAMPPAAAARWRKADGGRVRLVNAYGPTEAVITATAWEVPADFGAEDDSTRVPIGRPLPGRTARVLDWMGRIAPIGVIGELCLGGLLARGYRGRAELTAERFVPDPFSSDPDARLYRTGDLARWLADGTLEFVGRTDTQVKLRGYRIEPGEVDAVLASHPAALEAVTVVREDAPGVRRLVSYVASPRPAEEVEDELREWVRDRLPEHMVPAALVVLSALPHTPTGKVDRDALPVPAAEAPKEDAAEPGTRKERVLARVWADVLGVADLHPTSNFFALGGDSILSIAVIARAAQEGLRLTPKQVFQHQTLAEMAAAAEESAGVEAEQGEVTGDVPLTPVQRLFFDEAHPEPAHWNLAFLLAAPAGTDPALLARAVESLMLHHDALRMRFARTDAGWTQRNAPAGDFAPFESLDFTAIPDEELALAIERRAEWVQRSLSLEEGPIVRFVWFDLGGERGGRLLIVAHHLVLDGVSWAVLREDLEAAYAQLSRGEPVRLPLKTTSFREWAVRLAGHAGTEDAAHEAAWWSAAVPSGVRPLPEDRPGAPDTEGAAGIVPASLDEEETRALLQDAHAAYHTRINDLLLAALARAYRRWTGEPGVLVDLEGHGREDLFAGVDLSRTVGWFTTVFPVWIDAGTEEAPGEAVKGAKERLRATPNHGIGYGVLRYLSPDASVREAMARVPKPRISFNYLGQAFAGGGGGGRFQPAGEPVGPTRSPHAPREHAIACDALVADGRLHLAWSYGTNVFERATVERLAALYTEELRALVRHCLDPQAGGFTPSDFPAAAGLDQSMLDSIFSQIGG